MSKKQKNKYGIKVDDVFCMNSLCGRSGIYKRFFQVIDLRGKTQVVVKEIEFEKIGENEQKEDLVIPCRDKFLKECSYKEDNNIGATKIVQKRIDSDNEKIIYLSFNWYFNRSRYDNTVWKSDYYQTAEL